MEQHYHFHVQEHVLSVEQVCKLIYQRGADENTIRPPLFLFTKMITNFMILLKSKRNGKEGSHFCSIVIKPFTRTISSSFYTNIYRFDSSLLRKILLSLQDLIKEQSFSKLTLLDYLKQLHSKEWDSFVQDSKMIQTIKEMDEDKFVRENMDDLPYYCIGFKDSSPENVLRTRIWAALRCQYRTVSGFMNYVTALKLLLPNGSNWF